MATVAFAALAVVVSAKAAVAYNGDLIGGFTTASGNDVMFDLGQASALTVGETFPSLTTLLTTDFSDLTTVHWGVIGNALNGIGGSVDNTIWVTKATGITPPGANQTKYNSVKGQTANMYALFPAAGAGQSTTPSSTGPNRKKSI